MFLNPLNRINVPCKEEPEEVTTEEYKNYAYEVLFKTGHNSDIFLRMLDNEWKLHKFVLIKYPFFARQFIQGTNFSQLIEVDGSVDPDITIAGIHTALAFLYDKGVDLEPLEMLGIIAAAKRFELDNLIDRCLETMEHTINVDNVLTFRKASKKYKLCESMILVNHWLDWNFMTKLAVDCEKLRGIPVKDLIRIIQRPIYIQNEKALYSMLKMWLYLQFAPDWDGKADKCLEDAHDYFVNFDGRILESECGQKLAPPFEEVRVTHLIDDAQDKAMLLEEKLIPTKLIERHAIAIWRKLLEIGRGTDGSLKLVSEALFDNHSYRCGRVIPNEERFTWRWSGFHYGMDIVLTFTQRTLLLKRNMSTDRDNMGCVGGNLSQKVMYKVTFADFNELSLPREIKSTGMKTVNLFKEQDVTALEMTPTMKFPLAISIKFLISVPLTAHP